MIPPLVDSSIEACAPCMIGHLDVQTTFSISGTYQVAMRANSKRFNLVGWGRANLSESRETQTSHKTKITIPSEVSALHGAS